MKSFKYYLTEIFQRERKFLKFISINHGEEYYYKFNLKENKISVEVEFALMDDKIYSVGFTVNGSIIKYDVKHPIDGLLIYNSVLNVCLDFLDYMPNETIVTFTPYSKGNEKVYSLLNKYKPKFKSMGYLVDYDNQTRYATIRKIK